MALAEESRATIDHEAIRRWAEERDGYPATVAGTEGDDEAGVLRIGFDDEEQDLRRVSWEEFFAKFEEKALSFLHRNEPEGDGTSRWHRFTRRR